MFSNRRALGPILAFAVVASYAVSARGEKLPASHSFLTIYDLSDDRSEPLPQNTRLWLIVHNAPSTMLAGAPRMATRDEVIFRLRRGKVESPIDFLRRGEVGGGEFVEIVPRSGLESEQRYSLWAQAAWEDSNEITDRIVSSFAVSSSVDEEPPLWDGPRSIDVQAVTDGYDAKSWALTFERGILWDDGSPRNLMLWLWRIQLGRPIDDTRPDDVDVGWPCWHRMDQSSGTFRAQVVDRVGNRGQAFEFSVPGGPIVALGAAPPASLRVKAWISRHRVAAGSVKLALALAGASFASLRWRRKRRASHAQ